MGERPASRSLLRFRRPPVGLLGSSLVLLAVIVVPVVALIGVALDEVGGSDGLGGSALAEAIANSLSISLLAATLAVGLGTATALVTERLNPPGRGWLRYGIMFPIVVPGFVTALGWTRAYGPGGLTDRALGWTLPGLYGRFGIVVVIAAGVVPLCHVIVSAALAALGDEDLERAALASGASRLTTIRTVTLPLVRAGIAGAAALAFVMAMNAFGVPAVLGTPARITTVTTRIYQDYALSARPEAFARAVFGACVLVIVTVPIAAFAERLLRPSDRTVAHGPPVLARRATARHRLAAVGVWMLIAAVSIVPLLALLATAVTRAIGLPPTPDNWTWAHFADAFDGRLADAFATSTLLAGSAALVAVGLGWVSSRLSRGRRPISLLVLLGFAIPGSSLAVGVLLSYGSLLRGTLLLILIAYLAKLWAVGHRVLTGVEAGIDPELASAGRVSGASPATATWTLTVPMMRPGIITAVELVGLLAFHELTMSSLLYGPRTATLAVSVLNLQQIGDVPTSSALAVLIVMPPLLVALAVGGWRTSRRRAGRA